MARADAVPASVTAPAKNHYVILDGLRGVSLRIARFFGDLSYPLYITHYPLVYIYMAWIVTGKPTTNEAIVGGVAVAAASIALAYASLKLYDLPVRRWLGKRLLSRSA